MAKKEARGNPRNPFFPTETTYGKETGKKIMSPAGSAFDVIQNNTNAFDQRLKNAAKGTGRGK